MLLAMAMLQALSRTRSAAALALRNHRLAGRIDKFHMLTIGFDRGSFDLIAEP